MVQLLSRNTRDLSRWFPELLAAGRAPPVQTVIDGEIVIADDSGRSDFTALQERPTWRRVPSELVCEVSYATLDAGRWLRQPARFVRWRPDRTLEDCDVGQLGRH